MEPDDELAEYLKNPYVKVIGGATDRTVRPGESIANTATTGGTPETGVARPPEADKRAGVCPVSPARPCKHQIGQKSTKGGAQIGGSSKPSKYLNQKTEYNGRLYASLKEANYARELDLMVKNGALLSWIPQVSFPLTVGRHIIDFMLIYPWDHERRENHFKVVEIKGRDLPMGRRKRKEFAKLYKVEVIVI